MSISLTKRVMRISKEMVGLAVAKIVPIRTNLTVFVHVEVRLVVHVCQVINKKLQLLESLLMSEAYQHMGMVVKLMTMY